MTEKHQPVETLAELLTLDNSEVVAGYTSAEKGDPEPGMNHTRAFHHGWRMAMMDLHEIEIPQAHRRLVHEYVAHGGRKP